MERVQQGEVVENQGGGHGTGFRAQLLFFLDDLLPSVFGNTE